MKENEPNILFPELKSKNVLEVKESLPQTPEIPWNDYAIKSIERFRHLRVTEGDDQEWPPKFPNMPAEYQKMYLDIPYHDKDIDKIVENNKKLRCSIGEDSSKIFYRPGIGFGGALHEILEKMGTYGAMIITDPVYEGEKMKDWSEGMLPIDYYIKTLKLLDAKDINVSIAGSISENKNSEMTYGNSETQIPLHGSATIKCKVNGVELTFYILAEDMTKFHPTSYDIISFGRPTPPDGAEDPRYFQDFVYDTIQNLSMNGIVDYNEESFDFIPAGFAPEIFGFKVIEPEQGSRKFIQKVEETGESLKKVFEIAQYLRSTLLAFAGKIPSGGWVGSYYKNVTDETDEKILTVENVIEMYKLELLEIKQLLSGLSDQKNKMIQEKMENLFMNPISINGQISLDKIEVLGEDKSEPYGSIGELAEEHSEGKINAVDFYQKLIQNLL